MDRQTDRYLTIYTHSTAKVISGHCGGGGETANVAIQPHIDRQTHRDRQTDRQTDDIQTDRQTDRQTDT